MNQDEKYNKMDYEVEIKRLEKRIDILDRTLAIAIIAAVWVIAYSVISAHGGRSY